MAKGIDIADVVKRRVGLRVLARIKERTLQGIDAHGKPFAGYSEKTFAAPAASLGKKVFATLDKAGKLSFFHQEQTLWARVEGGYKLVKATKRPADGGVVNLTDTGKLLRGLRLLSIDEQGAIRIGWDDPELALLAYYHNVSGAGPGRVVRKFLGIADPELIPIVQEEIAKEQQAVSISADILKQLSKAFQS